jgi:hypothetical protein
VIAAKRDRCGLHLCDIWIAQGTGLEETNVLYVWRSANGTGRKHHTLSSVMLYVLV